jgi:polysaccharide export outer membrane protein/exopolysaccharide production protein ExoF
VNPTPAAQDYKLGPQDKIRLKVFEWRTTMNTVVVWPALNAEFTVSASGVLSLPILGEVPAAGQTPSTLAKSISTRLKSIVKLSDAPAVAVEVVKYRPFYIMGGINKPGEYPYRPGLTVLQALSVAGGVLGSGESGLRAEQDIISGRGKMQETNTEIGMLLAKKARLETEAAGRKKITFPPILAKRKKAPAIALLIQQEEAIFRIRQNALRTEIAALEQLKDFLEQGIKSIQEQIKVQEKERKLMKKQLKNISSLVSRGLTPATRQLELQRAVSRMEGDHLRLQSTLLTAQQNLSRTDISIIEAKNKRSNEVATELRETQTKLEIAVARYNTAEQLLSNSQFTSPQILKGHAGTRKPTFTIIRGDNKIQAKETTLIEPGDTLQVRLPAPKGLGSGLLTPSFATQ